MLFILPVNTNFMNWSQEITKSLPQYTVPLALAEDKWWDWAEQLILLNNLSNCPNPNRNLYETNDSWVKWAEFFVNYINTL